MAIWMEYEQFRKQIEAGVDIEVRPPCPSDHVEPVSGRSHWMSECPDLFQNMVTDGAVPSSVDVLIIGSGITGAVVAYQLARQRPDLKIAVVDARGICTGATGRNGGHISRPECYDMRYLAKTFGVEEAVRLRRLPILTRDMMLQTIQELELEDEVDLQLGGTFCLFGSEEEKLENEEDMKFAEKAGMPIESYLLDSESLKKKINVSDQLTKHGAALLDKSGSFFPAKFVAGLFRKAQTLTPNLTLHPHTAVSAVTQDESGSRYMVETKKGSISSRVVVHATNAWAGRLVPSLRGSKGVFGVKCHVIAVQPTNPQPTQLNFGFGFDRMWHWGIQRPNGGPFVYGFSGTEQIADYNDAITIDDEAAYEQMFQFLHGNFAGSFPVLPTHNNVTSDWTGIQGYSSNGASLVGRPSRERPGEFMSVGHNGEGMGRCFSCSTVLADKIVNYLEGQADSDWSPPEWFPKSFIHNV